MPLPRAGRWRGEGDLCAGVTGSRAASRNAGGIRRPVLSDRRPFGRSRIEPLRFGYRPGEVPASAPVCTRGWARPGRRTPRCLVGALDYHFHAFGDGPISVLADRVRLGSPFAGRARDRRHFQIRHGDNGDRRGGSHGRDPRGTRVDYMPQGRSTNLRVGMQAAETVASIQKAARESEVAIVFAGERAGESMDRTSLTLPGDLDNLIETVAAVNRRTVVVLNTAGPVAMPWIDNVAAVIWAGHPGAFDGSSIAALLFGDANPSGKLAVTFPLNEQQGPATKPDEYPGDGKVVNFTEGLLVGYRWYDAKNQTPLFPFGHGLSYTAFRYSDLKVEQTTVKVRISNIGKRAGAEVVQLYLGYPDAAGEPPKQLKGFEKVWLKPGEAKVVSLPVSRESLSVWDDGKHDWKVVPGTYTVNVGSSSRDIRAKGSLVVR